MTQKPLTLTNSDQPRFPWIDLAIVLLSALALRLVHLYTSAASPIFSYLTYDSIYYHTVAQYLAGGQELGHEGVFKAPLYALLVALNYAIFGVNIFTTLFLQNVFGTLSCGLIYLIALKLFPRRVALTAGLLAAACGTLIYFDSEFLPVSVTLLLQLVSLWALLQFAESRKMVYPLIAGVAIALGAATMPETLILAPAALWWLWRLRTPESVRRSHLLAFVVAIILPLIPLQIRNYEIGREAIPLLTDVGVRLAIANNAEATGRDFRLPNSTEEAGQSYLEAVEAAHRTNGREVALEKVGGFWLGRAAYYVLKHPLDWLGLELRKFALLISGYEVSLDKPIYFFAEQSPVLRWLLWEGLFFFPFGLIIPLSVLAFFSGRLTCPGDRLLRVFVLALALAILAFSPFSHQRLLLAPIVIIWASAGLWRLIALLRSADYRRFYRNLAILVLSVIFVNGIILIAGKATRVDSRLEGHVYAANAYMAAGNVDQAKSEFERALRADSRSPRPYSGLAGIHLRQGNDSLAVLNYMRAAGLAPSDDRPYKGIVASYKRRQNVTQLNQVLVDVIRLFPKARWAYVEYADLHMRLNEYTQAADIYESAFQADSTYFDAIFRKGETYLLGDLRQESEIEFLRYLEYMPSSIEAHANLGQVYARQNRLDLAQQQFEFVRSAQPYSPASYFNLASLALQRDEFERSHAYLDTARMLNPAFPGLEIMHHMIDSLRAASPPR